MNVNASSVISDFVDAADRFQASDQRMTRFVGYKALKKAEGKLQQKFKIFCKNSSNIDMDKTIKKARDAYGEKVAAKMRRWSQKDDIKAGDQEFPFSENFQWAADRFSKIYNLIIKNNDYSDYCKTRSAYKAAIQEALACGQTVGGLKQALEKKSVDFSEKTHAMIK